MRVSRTSSPKSHLCVLHGVSLLPLRPLLPLLFKFTHVLLQPPRPGRPPVGKVPAAARDTSVTPSVGGVTQPSPRQSSSSRPARVARRLAKYLQRSGGSGGSIYPPSPPLGAEQGQVPIKAAKGVYTPVCNQSKRQREGAPRGEEASNAAHSDGDADDE
eukprot:1009246-Prorocentrum_minimum.AAC.1